jgi:hypothetical protein
VDPDHDLTETGKIKCAAHSKSHSGCGLESIIFRSYKKCCISSNALDESENDIVWEDDVEDNDSDWVQHG